MSDYSTDASSLSKYIVKYRHFSLLSLYGVAQVFFMYCEKTVRPKYYMFSVLDSYIPFVKEFVVPYLFWFAYMAIGFIYLGLVSKKDYYRLCIFIFGGMGICYTIYLLFPNAQNLRPIITETDIFSRMIQHIYATDTNTNVAPSIHVLNSVAVHITLIKCPAFRKKRFWKAASLFTAITISASTVFIKQHSIKDGMWSLLLAAVLYYIIYHLPKLLANKAILLTKAKEFSVE